MEMRFFHHDVEKFIQSLEKPTFAKTIRMLELLEAFGNRLEMPHSKPVTAGMFELRIRGMHEIRLFYCFHKNVVVVLHGCVKKSNTMPVREIRLALKRKSTLDGI